MEAFISTLWSALPGIASAAVIALCGFAYKKLKSFKAEHTALLDVKQEFEDVRKEFDALKVMQENQNEALRNILRDILIKEHKRVVERGNAHPEAGIYSTPDEKRDFDSTYKSYHAFNGNGTGTSLWEDYMHMPNYPKDEEE